MARAFDKEVKRSITHSLGRFLAIAIIAALGCGFFAGLRMTSLDMDLSADIFCDETNLSDLYVTSSLGLDEPDVDRIAQVEGVAAVAVVKLVDSYASIGDAKYVVRFNSIDLEAARASDSSDGQRAVSDDASYINRPVLVEGSWPAGPGECVVAADAVLDAPVEVGDRIRVVPSVNEDDDALITRSFVVTGLVRSPYYLMTSNFGTSSLGSGEVETYAYVAPSEFSEDYPFTGAFVIVDGARERSYPSISYDELVDAVVARLEAIGPELRAERLASIKADAQAELDDARAEYDDSYASAMAQLDAAAAQLSDAKEQLDDSARTLASSEATLADSHAQIVSGEEELAAGREQLALEQEKLDQGRVQYEAGLAQWQQAADAAAAGFAAQQAQVDLIEDPLQRAYAQAALDQQKALAQEQLDAQRAPLDEARTELDAGQRQLDAAFEHLERESVRLEAGMAAYEDGRTQLASGYARYDEGLASYESGLASYERERASALEQLADARSQIDEAQADIDALELPELFILDRGKNVGVAGHQADADRIDQIARIFPLIFFLVAALVVLTTMTRMVDEERMLIGTYKALGYGNARIVSKYLIYALVASGVGSIVGIVVLSQFLPQLIMQAYSTIYALPVSISPIDVPIALIAFALSVGITLLATWLAAMSSLRERPALLMLPRAPKPGKRILLERIGPLWRRLNFSGKVTARNLFRYKQRFLMAVIGIAGCTALLLTGLGLHDGINDIIEKQFGELQHFNLEIQTNEDQDAADAQRVQGILDGSSIVTDSMRIGHESVLASDVGSNEDFRASIYVPQDIEKFAEFFTLRQRTDHAPLALGDDGAIVSEKLATELGVGAGDLIQVYDQSAVGERTGEPHQLLVAGVTEVYTGQRIFMTPLYYEEAMGKPLVENEIISKAEAPAQDRTALANQILDVEGVEVVSFYDEIIETYKTMLETVNAVVIVLIVAAALLAFVVIYNLTNINITERTREIATLKVLGFTPRETNAYILRETILLTVIGALVGLVLGVWMEGFVVVTAEVNEMMFGREIHFASFAIAFLLTIVFSMLVSLAMRPKIKAIDMVQSLKSVD